METSDRGTVRRITPRAAAIAIALVGITIAALWTMGRSWWCACGSWSPISLDVWSRHNSQHLLDAYAGSHFQHGLVFYAALWLLLRGRAPDLRFLLAVALECGWEIFENTPLVIDRYRAATASLDYSGDAILNSVSDVGLCALGTLAASRLPWSGTLALYLGIEIAMVVWIRDSLLLNVLMLLWPIEAVKQWQTP
jgi:hypothetical protein